MPNLPSGVLDVPGTFGPEIKKKLDKFSGILKVDLGETYDSVKGFYSLHVKYPNNDRIKADLIRYCEKIGSICRRLVQDLRDLTAALRQVTNLIQFRDL